jgi:alkylhydroperoxidase family enzyme
MALIQITPPEKAEGKLAELYKEVETMFGIVPSGVQLLGVSPGILDNQIAIMGHFHGHSTLSTPLLAMIRMMISNACKSKYCVGLNNRILQGAGFSQDQVDAALADPKNAPLNEKDKALLLFVLKACDNPHSTVQEDVDGLKSLGWSETDIFEAVAHGARAVGTNIIFDTFKVD